MTPDTSVRAVRYFIWGIIDAKAFALHLKMKLNIAVHCIFWTCLGLLCRSVEVKRWCAILFHFCLGLGELVVGREELASGAWDCQKGGDSL